MRRTGSSGRISALFVLFAGLAACLPGLVASEHCYNGPPELLDCVTNPSPDTFCHLHFQLLDDTDCDRRRPVLSCRPVGCHRDDAVGLYRMTYEYHMVYRECKFPGSVQHPEGCWHCAAWLVCRVDYYYKDSKCKDRAGTRYHWYGQRSGCY